MSGSPAWNLMFHRELAEDSHGGDCDDSHGSFGVHITYNDLYSTVLFLAAIYVGGKVASKGLKMPDLVGEIFVGIALGPELLDFAPNPEAWVLLGELGLILLVIEAGIDIDVATLKMIGARGMCVAIVGSILPILLAMVIAALVGAGDWKAILAAGATFGPTSLGIALNILRGGGILNTPIGQLIISAAVIDDMIALVILSQLDALTGDSIELITLLIPIFSAILFLTIGGYIAIFVLPPNLEKYVLPKLEEKYHDKFELSLMIFILLFMMPATKYGKASYLMGAFIAGLSFCTSHGLHTLFVRQFKRLLQWLMRIFFAASIGFQVPITSFANGPIIFKGLVYSLALFGKLGVGFMVPNFTQSRRFTQFHLRDCLITGFSMAAEGEFAFVIAVFSVDAGLIDTETYASVVLAVLLSTIVPPFLLRYTISHYAAKTTQAIETAAQKEMERKHDLGAQRQNLHSSIINKTTVFMCIQTQSDSQWGLMFKLMSTMAKCKLEVIDHRSWHPRGVHATNINEVYVRYDLDFMGNGAKKALDESMEDIKTKIEETINQPGVARVKVQRWYPGVVEEIIEENDGGKQKSVLRSTESLGKRIHMEAEKNLSRKGALMENATKGKSVQEIFQEMKGDKEYGKEIVEQDKKEVLNNEGSDKKQDSKVPTAGDIENNVNGNADTLAPMKPMKPTVRKRRPNRVKTRSTPVVGGGLFGETAGQKYGKIANAGNAGNDSDDGSQASSHQQRVQSIKDMFKIKTGGYSAEITIRGETYKIKVSDETYKALQTGVSGETLDSHGISVKSGLSIQQDETNVVSRLQGYVRSADTLGTIQEYGDDEESEPTVVLS